MKTNYFFITVLILIFCSCKQNENSSGNDLTTVDSNVVGADSNSAILHLDNAKNHTNFPVAMDSASPAIKASDTGYHKKKN
jgi:hypothetical protein